MFNILWDTIYFVQDTFMQYLLEAAMADDVDKVCLLTELTYECDDRGEQ